MASRSGWTVKANPFEEHQRRTFFENLDGLRGLSILFVLFHHVPHVPKEHVLHVLQANGRYGVSLFFVVSGFLIASLLLMEQKRYGAVSLKNFYIRRSLRLFPLYYAVLGLEALLVFLVHAYSPENQAIFRQKLPSYLLYYSNLTSLATVGPFFFAWSLAVEEQFYLVFSQLFHWLRPRVLVALIATALLGKVVLCQVGSLDLDTLGWRIGLSYAEPVLEGVLLAYALQVKGLFRYVSRLTRGPALGGLAVLLGVGLALVELHDKSGLGAQLLYLGVTALVGGLAMRSAVPGLGSPLLSHVGKISYGIYLLHMTLSTCPWSRKAKAFLDDKAVDYSYIDHDLA
ncbi:MAG: acyltransferase family protein, partial [Myxococcales bacterium]